MLARYNAVVVCSSVHTTVRCKPVLYRNNWTDRANFFGMHASFHLSYTVNSSSYKIRVFSSVTLSQTLDIKQISPRQVDRVANKTRRWSSLLSTLNNGPRSVAGRSTLCTHHEHNLRPCCSNSITSICFFLPLCNSWQDFN